LRPPPASPLLPYPPLFRPLRHYPVERVVRPLRRELLRLQEPAHILLDLARHRLELPVAPIRIFVVLVREASHGPEQVALEVELLGSHEPGAIVHLVDLPTKVPLLGPRDWRRRVLRLEIERFTVHGSLHQGLVRAIGHVLVRRALQLIVLPAHRLPAAVPLVQRFARGVLYGRSEERRVGRGCRARWWRYV